MGNHANLLTFLLATSLFSALCQPGYGEGPKPGYGEGQKPGYGDAPKPGYGRGSEDLHSPYIAASFNNDTDADVPCAVTVDVGPSWVNATSPGEYFVVYLKISSKTPVETPWTLVVESPYYADLAEYWNWHLDEAHDGYFSGKVELPWEVTVEDHSNVVDIGFVAHTREKNLEEVWKLPQYVSVGGHVCNIYSE